MPARSAARRSRLAKLALVCTFFLLADLAAARVVPNSPRVPGHSARPAPAHDLTEPPPGCDDAARAQRPARGLVLSNSPQCRKQARDYLLRAILAMNRARR